MRQIERIAHMEQILDEAAETVSLLGDALEKYEALEEKLQALSDYYGSQQWRQDFDDDSAGKLPADLKRGVLSEDAVYHLLMENSRLKKEMKRLSAGNNSDEEIHFS